MSSSNRRNPADVADVSYVYCTPPGVGVASDFVPRHGGNTTRSTGHKYSHVDRKNVDNLDPRIPGSVIGSILDKRSLNRILEMMVFQENLALCKKNPQRIEWIQRWETRHALMIQRAPRM